MQKAKFLISILLIIYKTICSFENTALADPIYQGQDSKGRTIYTSKPSTSGAAVADLPPIQHQAAGQQNVPALYTCQPHAGIDCKAGADQDGSVICRDAFRDAAARFQDHCSQARLEIGDITAKGSNGAFSVLIRNNSAVDAQDVTVSYRPKLGRRVDLNGPDVIEAFGAAEFEYTPAERLLYGVKPIAAQLMLECLNCNL